MKRVIKQELHELILSVFRTACNENGVEYCEINVNLFINSIYAKLSFECLTELDLDKIVNSFTDILKKYAGENLKPIKDLNKNEIIIQVEYELKD